MGYYKLENPRESIKEATISVFYIQQKEYATVSVKYATFTKDLGYTFNGLTAAKQYFSRWYQSKKDGFETPKWKRID